jgi:branched-chain amino acid transport system substrate-binding protein
MRTFMANNWFVVRPAPHLSLIVVAAIALVAAPAKAQAGPGTEKPYASMNRNAVYYAGTGAGASHDMGGNRVTIGMILPLEGPLAAQGKILLQAAQMALDEESKNPLPDGQHLALAVRDESGPWGQASEEIVRLILQDNAVAVITSPEGTIAHQAEQIANRIGVPVVTLSSDATTTQINMPWIFRLGPSDEDEAFAFARNIYQTRGFSRVLLLAEADHDGRVGADQFERVARQLDPTPPLRMDLPSSPEGIESASERAKTLDPDAVVLWTDYDLAARLIRRIRLRAPGMPIYVCRKAAEFSAMSEPSGSDSAESKGNDAEIWVSVSSARMTPAGRRFEKNFASRTGTEPNEAAGAAYDAVHAIAGALRRAGDNRVRVRDVLASGKSLQGMSGSISFDSAGNERGRTTVVGLNGALSAGSSF